MDWLLSYSCLFNEVVMKEFMNDLFSLNWPSLLGIEVYTNLNCAYIYIYIYIDGKFIVNKN